MLEAVFAPIPAAPPANDQFAAAAQIGALPATFTELTTGATAQSGEPLLLSGAPCDTTGASVGKTIWYRYTATRASAVTVTTAGSDYDTVLTLSTGSSLGNLRRVACNDDADAGPQARITFQTTANTTYYLQAGGYNGDSGTLRLRVSSTGPATDLTVSLTGSPSEVIVGQRLALTSQVVNRGPLAATGATYSIDLPAGASGVVARTTRGSCATALPRVTCQIGTLAIEQSATITIELVAGASNGGLLTATVDAVEDDTEPANNTATHAAIVRPAACIARPPVRVQTSRTGDGRLVVTITAGVGAVRVLNFGASTNAALTVGSSTRTSGSFAYAVPGGAASTSFYVRQIAPNAAATVPLVVEDDCGRWETFVGGGASAF